MTSRTRRADTKTRRQTVAARFTATMRELDPGVRIGLRWLVYAIGLFALTQQELPRMLSWLP